MIVDGIEDIVKAIDETGKITGASVFVARNALKARIPLTVDVYGAAQYCPVCKYSLGCDILQARFCPWCGQALKE